MSQAHLCLLVSMNLSVVDLDRDKCDPVSLMQSRSLHKCAEVPKRAPNPDIRVHITGTTDHKL